MIDEADVYLVGHGAYVPADGEVIVKPEVTFYGMPDQVLHKATGVSRTAADSYGIQLIPTPWSEKVPNYRFHAPEESDLIILGLKTMMRESEQSKLKICGTDPEFPDGSFLCNNDPGCTTGVHSCSGVLGSFPGKRVKILCCRAPLGDEGAAWDFGGEGHSADITEETSELLKVLHDSYADEQWTVFTNGTFANYFDRLPQQVQADLLLCDAEFSDWWQIRCAYYASDFFQNFDDLLAYLRGLVQQDYNTFKTIVQSSHFLSRMDYVALMEAETRSSPDVIYDGIFAAVYEAAVEKSLISEPTGNPEVDLWADVRQLYVVTHQFTDAGELEKFLIFHAKFGRSDIVDIVLKNPDYSAPLSDLAYVAIRLHAFLAEGNHAEFTSFYQGHEAQLGKDLWNHYESLRDAISHLGN